jgi:NAD(P)H-nitrite reductase large subunit
MCDRKLIICRCEEVTQEEIIDSIRSGARSVNDIKRMTRAGMGLCQGRTCQRLVSQLLQKKGRGLDEPFPKPSTFRPPVRAIKIGELAGEECKG